MNPVNANGLLRTSECDELDQFSKAVGWEAEYHQLGKGAYKAWIEYSIHPKEVVNISRFVICHPKRKYESPLHSWRCPENLPWHPT